MVEEKARGNLAVKRVYYSPDLEGFLWGRRQIERFSAYSPQPKLKEELKEELYLLSSDPIGEGKGILYLSLFKGPLLKPCPGTKGYICCGYWVGNIVAGCPMDCSYCVLQVYLNEPFLVLQLPWEKFFQEVKERANGPLPVRIGTGELSDSLVLEPLIGFVKEAVSFFRGIKAVLELKTKTDNVDFLQGLPHDGHTVVAWSLAPQRVIEDFERGTAPLKGRLKAAKKCLSWGYPLAFHFDPILHYPGLEEDYRELIEELFSHIDPKGVIWISMGTFRFPKGLDGIIRRRFPRSWLLTGELFPASDGKVRYLKPLRVEIYKKVLNWLKEYDHKAFVYLCMEREDVWMATFGFAPKGTKGLKEMLEKHTEVFLRKW